MYVRKTGLVCDSENIICSITTTEGKIFKVVGLLWLLVLKQPEAMGSDLK
jgi:hypothetical protein